MALDPSLYTALKADIEANSDPTVVAALQDGANQVIADWYNQIAAPEFWVWRTAISKAEIYGNVSQDATTWSWSDYAGAVGEHKVWDELFSFGENQTMDPSSANNRSGVLTVFPDQGQQTAPNRQHIESLARERATNIEKLFATGVGSTGSPATRDVVGSLSWQDVVAALNS